jgi:hypothetical protein
MVRTMAYVERVALKAASIMRPASSFSTGDMKFSTSAPALP